MAKAKPATDDIAPATFGDDFVASPEVGATDRTSEPKEVPKAEINPERMRAELAASKARNAELEAQVAASSKAYPSGRKYKVTLKDGPTCVVEPKAGEHPWDCAKRLGGIVSSINAPEISEAAEHEQCGTHLINGTVRPFARV